MSEGKRTLNALITQLDNMGSGKTKQVIKRRKTWTPFEMGENLDRYDTSDGFVVPDEDEEELFEEWEPEEDNSPGVDEECDNDEEDEEEMEKED